MFEVGKEYEFVTLQATEDGLCEYSQQWTVKAIDGAVLHLNIPGKDDSESAAYRFLGPTVEQNLILNTASCFFHSARPVDDIQAERENAKAQMEQLKSGMMKPE